MASQARTTEIPGVLVIDPAVHRDARGYFFESYRADRLAAAGIHRTFVQDNVSRSVRGVVRGLHYQLANPQAKLITVLRGEVFDVVADIRRGSPTFGRWMGIILSEANHRQLFVPEGCAHGFMALSDVVDFHYKNSAFYTPGDEYGILWNDPDLAVDWPDAASSLSPKDAALPRLRQAPTDHLPRWSAAATTEL